MVKKRDRYNLYPIYDQLGEYLKHKKKNTKKKQEKRNPVSVSII